MSTLSLSLSLSLFLVDFCSFLSFWLRLMVFFKTMCFGNVCFLISHYKVFSLPFIALIEFWYELILVFLEIGIWVYVKTQSTWLRIWICLPIFWVINHYKVYLLFLLFYHNEIIVILWWIFIIMIISLFLKRWEIWIINLKLIKFSCISNITHYSKSEKNIVHLKKNINQTYKIYLYFVHMKR